MFKDLEDFGIRHGLRLQDFDTGNARIKIFVDNDGQRVNVIKYLEGRTLSAEDKAIVSSLSPGSLKFEDSLVEKFGPSARMVVQDGVIFKKDSKGSPVPFSETDAPLRHVAVTGLNVGYIPDRIVVATLEKLRRSNPDKYESLRINDGPNKGKIRWNPAEHLDLISIPLKLPDGREIELPSDYADWIKPRVNGNAYVREKTGGTRVVEAMDEKAKVGDDFLVYDSPEYEMTKDGEKFYSERMKASFDLRFKSDREGGIQVPLLTGYGLGVFAAHRGEDTAQSYKAEVEKLWLDALIKSVNDENNKFDKIIMSLPPFGANNALIAAIKARLPEFEGKLILVTDEDQINIAVALAKQGVRTSVTTAADVESGAGAHIGMHSQEKGAPAAQEEFNQIRATLLAAATFGIDAPDLPRRRENTN